jgi:hypothetical protein
MFLLLPFMTEAALHRLQLVVMRDLRTIQVLVAHDAVQVPVSRVGVVLGVHEHRDLLTVPFSGEIRVLMAKETLLVLLGKRCRQAREDGRGEEQAPSRDPADER